MTAPNRDPGNRCAGSGSVISEEHVVADIGFCPTCGRPVKCTKSVWTAPSTYSGREVPNHGIFVTRNTKAHDDLLRTVRQYSQ